jgi:valyl-tRNA synthetase
MGHGFNQTLMDALTVITVRGANTLWRRTDHAGIATQIVASVN